MHLAVDAHGMPVRMRVTAGTVADSTQALELIEGIEAEYLLADKGYDSNAIVKGVLKRGMNPVIPSRQEPQGNSENMIVICIGCVIWWRTGFANSNSGVV